MARRMLRRVSIPAGLAMTPADAPNRLLVQGPAVPAHLVLEMERQGAQGEFPNSCCWDISEDDLVATDPKISPKGITSKRQLQNKI